jgi:type I restriction enzyme S subunit
MGDAIPAGFRRTEVGLIPEDWDVKPIHTLADKIMVGIASAATHAYRNRGVVMFRNQNIKPGYLDDSDVLYIDEDYEETFRNKRLRAGDLLTARTGYPGTTSIVPVKYEGAQSFTTLITRPRRNAVDSEYLCCFINSEAGQSFFDQNQTGGGQKNVNAGILKHLPVPLPPTKAEQEAIAEALGDADAWIESLEQLVAKKRHLKQAAMQQLLTGNKRLPGFHGEWKPRRLSDCLLAPPDYGINAAGVEFDGALPAYLRITDIDDDGRLLSDNRVAVDHPSSMEYVLKSNDVVFARTGASVGKSYLYRPSDGQLVFAGFLIRARLAAR